MREALARRVRAGVTRAPAAVAAIALAFAGALGVAACAPDPKPKPSFIVLVIDTLRADRLGHAGYPRATPAFDALAGRSVRFSRALASAPWTLPSLASLFTSQIASRHRVTLWGAHLPPEHLTLPEVLREAGYRTAARTANVLFDRSSGFAQGFDSYQVVFAPEARGPDPPSPFPNASARRVGEAGLDWMVGLRRREPGAPFFVYLHFMEPHTPYTCDRNAEPGCAERAAELNRRLHASQWDFDAGERDAIVRLYDGEVGKMDRALGQLVRALERYGLRENTWLIVTADHGEQLGRRGTYLHGRSLDRAEIHVPLLFSAPDGRASVVDATVSLIDVAPTLLDLAGIGIPRSFTGRSLVPALEGHEVPASPVVAEVFQTTEEPPRHRLAVVSGLEKIVLDPDGGLVRFDLETDPAEDHPLPATRADLSRALGALESSIDFRGALDAPEIDAEMRERLRALGYDSR